MSVPYWVEDAVFYQIFPDRFFNGDHSNDLPHMLHWDSAPTGSGFHGGDLRGIIEKFDYLLDLGINAIYLNPIFQATSNHRYNTSDYFKIDSKLGDMNDFRSLLNVAHQNNIRVILDGVFNHCGRGFFGFNDLLDNQERSLYKDWFHVLRFPIDAYSPGESEDYLAWWKYKSLPKFNISNPTTRKYLLNVARFWIEQGADGWRLDVPNEIDDDEFWAEFRQVVKQADSEAYILGEIWDVQPRWVGDSHFDGLMNYPLREVILGLVTRKIAPTQFVELLEHLQVVYPRENLYAMFVPLGSHDTERVLTVMGGSQAKAELALQLQFSLPGSPSIYYGDEIGLEGGKDPACRHTFPWDEKKWKPGLRDFVQRLVTLRRRFAALRRGNLVQVQAEDAKHSLAFGRVLGQEKILVVINASETKRSLRISTRALGLADGRILHNLTGPGEFIVADEEINVTAPAWSCSWLI
jgi:cyclomaltodextrinase / maltogenic alpha-amylase / neopullulanase